MPILLGLMKAFLKAISPYLRLLELTIQQQIVILLHPSLQLRYTTVQ